MRRSYLVVVVALFVGCLPGASSERQTELKPVSLPADHPPMALPDPDLQGGHVGRAPRRLTVAQLRESIRTTTGREWAQLNKLAPTLGQADFAFAQQEVTEMNFVFAKFMEDGARDVCMATATADEALPAGSRILSREVPASATDIVALDDATIRKNLSYLSKRFWGQVMVGDELDRYTTTFKTVAVRAKSQKKPSQAWAAVCVAMMTDTRFVTY